MEKKYRGVVVPMVTPFTKEGKLDISNVVKICNRFVEFGVSPFLLGTTGESSSVSISESRLLVKTAVETIKGKVYVYAGLCGSCVAQNIENAKSYVDLGADVLVSTLPSYYPLTPSQMGLYYERLADSVSQSIMMYNIPSTTHMSIPLDVVQAMSKHPNVMGFKDSERDAQRMEECVKMFHEREDFSYFSGDASLSSVALKLGADGIIPSTANFTPKMFKQLYDFSLAGQWEEAERVQRETNEIAQIYHSGRTLGESLQALKVMMSALDLCQPIAIPPLTDLPGNEQEEVLRATRIIMQKYQI
jgi:dihydrodipicolinate synthase/N-acetylneuraminate lyase